jgi:hypothetical protein
MNTIQGCQMPGYPRVGKQEAEAEPQSAVNRFKRSLAKPWNYLVKPQLKRAYKMAFAWKKRLDRMGQPAPTRAQLASTGAPGPLADPLKAGDQVQVRSRQEIEATLDPFKELKGCAFLEYMGQYCGTQQHVLQPVERFLDERDYKVKKARGVVLLEGVLCPGTPVFGRCDRACLLFWREEWLEKIKPASVPSEHRVE